MSVAASGSAISSIVSSCGSLETKLACPEKCPDGCCVCCSRFVILIRVAGVAGVPEELGSDICGTIAGDLCGNAGGGMSGSEIGSGETES